MIEIKTTCDCCGKRIGFSGFRLMLQYEHPTTGGLCRSDLCEDCIPKFEELVNKTLIRKEERNG